MWWKRFHIAVFISVVIHAAIVAAAIHIAHRKPVDISGGVDEGDTITITVISEDISAQQTSGKIKERPEVKRRRPQMISPLPSPAPKRSQAAPEKTETQAAGLSRGKSTSGRGADDMVGPGGGKSKKQLARIWSKINRSKYYPLHARRNLWEGKPRVTFKIGNEGEIEYVRLAKSCGITMLDEAAIETVKRAAPLPTYPKPITLTIRYSLRE